MKHTPWVLLGSGLLLGLIFDGLFYKIDQPGINVLLFQLSILAVSLGLAYYHKLKIPRGALVAATFAILYAFSFSVWTSDIGMTLSALGLLTANFFFAVYLLGHHGKFRHPLETAGEAVVRAVEIFFTRLSIFGHLAIPNLSPKKSAVARGVLIAIPILLIFFALFLGSDLLLQEKTHGFFDKLHDFLTSTELVGHLAIILFVGFCFLLFFAAAFWKRLDFKEFAKITSRFRIESAVILVSANVLFAAFILFQVTYLFGGQSAFDSIENLTYSQYAVHGFNELAAVAILVMLLIVTLRYFHAEDINKKMVTNAEMLLLGETFLIVISAWIRMSLYVQQYGFTPARLFGFWFFILAGILLVLLGVHIAKKIEQHKFMQQALIVIGVAMLIFTVSAPDALAVRLNIARTGDDGKIDPFPLFDSLSAEALPVMEYVLTNDRFDIGLLEDPKTTDYCGCVNHREYMDRVTDAWAYWYADGCSNKDDLIVRSSIVDFENRWNYFKFYEQERIVNENNSISYGDWIMTKSDWRSWNLSWSQARMRADGERRDTETQPYVAHDVYEACKNVHNND